MTDRFAGTSPSPVDAGSSLKVEFSNLSLANTTVTVTATNGQGSTEEIKIDLDADGNGSTKWAVPDKGWGLVRLSHPTSEDHTVPVTQGGATTLLESSENQLSNAAGDAFLAAEQAMAFLLNLRQRRDGVGRAAAAYLARLGQTARR